MLFIKNDREEYWNGEEFTPNHKKGIVYYSAAAASDEIVKISKTQTCKLTELTDEQWKEYLKQAGIIKPVGGSRDA